MQKFSSNTGFPGVRRIAEGKYKAGYWDIDNKEVIFVGVFETLDKAVLERGKALARYEKDRNARMLWYAVNEKKGHCFAMRNNQCTILKKTECIGCKFYKSLEEKEESDERTRKRLTELKLIPKM